MIMSQSGHQYFRCPPDLDREVEHLVEFLLKEAKTDRRESSVCSKDQDSVHVAVVTHVDRRVEPVIQNGPMCGLVALTMANGMLGGDTVGDKAAHPEVLLQAVKECGMSKNGEIFAVEYLKDLAQNQLHFQAEVVELSSLTLGIIDVVLEGKALLVPYDADKDHTPCLENGHKAHWCLVVGVAIVLASTENLNISQHCTPSPSLPGHFIIKDNQKVSSLAHKESLFRSSSQLCVFARHGKSAHLGLWKLTDLLESNKNLVEVDPKRTRPGEYVIPEGGIKKGLCGKALLISKRN